MTDFDYKFLKSYQKILDENFDELLQKLTSAYGKYIVEKSIFEEGNTSMSEVKKEMKVIHKNFFSKKILQYESVVTKKQNQ